MICKGCDKDSEKTAREQWWHCNGYFKISGTFCSKCYDKISHDSFGRPERPKDYLMMLMKMGATQ